MVHPAVSPASVQTTNDVVVADPFDVTVALRVTDVVDTDDAASLVMLGAEFDAVNESVEPSMGPPTLFVDDAR